MKLDVRDLHVEYQHGIAILRGVHMNARSGRVTVVIGPNGAGKSTLLRAVAGLIPIQRGTVEVNGVAITGASPSMLLSRGIAFVPQDTTTFPEMTVRENLHMGAWLVRRDKARVSARIDQATGMFPFLAGCLAERAGNLSGGQQKMLEIARGLMLDPKLLLLDEPTAGLAPEKAGDVYGWIRRLCAEQGITVLLVDQNVRQALAIADHAYVLTMGRNETDGSAPEVLAQLDDIVSGWMQRSGSGVTGT